MGFKEINIATDSQLKHEVGIKELGVRLSLKEFCASQIGTNINNQREQKKQKLISELLEGKKDKAKLSSKTKKNESRKAQTKISTHNISMGWIHNGVRVGLEKGGGTREMKASVTFSYKDMMEVGEKWFFPDGNSSMGPKHKMNLGLADFQRKTLLKTAGDVEFTLGDYCTKNGFKSRVRFYFTSEKKEISISYSSDEDDLIAPWSETLAGETSTTSSLMGTTQERSKVQEEQDKAYFDSLATDSRKVEERRDALEKEVLDVTRQECLRYERAKRVQAEPNIEEEHVIVLVRHLTLGTISRMFLKNSTMNQVYDWVGSLSLLPEYFRLVYPVSGEIVLPEKPVVEAANYVLCMNECEEPLSLVHEDPEISTAGFARDSDLSVENMSEFLPDQLMEEDESETGAVSTNFLLPWTLSIANNYAFFIQHARIIMKYTEIINYGGSIRYCSCITS